MMIQDNTESFIDYLYLLRRDKELTKKQICEGLCSINTYSAYENGKKGIGKNLQDRFLGRLGIGSNAFVYVTGVDEYDRWYERIEIIEKVISRQTEEALQLLEEFHKKKDCQDVLNLQFYNHMRAMIGIVRGDDKKEIYRFLEEAKKNTMPTVMIDTLENYALAPTEIDILSDYYYYGEAGGTRVFRIIIDYIEKKSYDPVARAYMLPKAVLYYADYLKREADMDMWSEISKKEVYQCCNRALEALREVKRSLYLWEILVLRQELLEALSMEDEMNYRWIEAIEYLYRKYGYEKETKETAILYITKNVYCINDIIRKRRKMFGITGEELAQKAEIDIRALRYIEARKRSPRRSTGKKLLRALYLPEEYSKCSLAVENAKDKAMLDALNRAMNQQKYHEAEGYYAYLEKRYRYSENIGDKQWLFETKHSIDYYMKRISREDYLKQLKEAIEITVPFEAIMENMERYLSYNETTMVYSYVRNLPDESEQKNQWMCFFEKYVIAVIDTPIGLSQSALIVTILDMVENARANRHEFAVANQYCEAVIKSALKVRELRGVSAMMYDAEWNMAEEKKATGESAKMRIQPLHYAFNLATLTKDEANATLFQMKIERIQKC